MKLFKEKKMKALLGLALGVAITAGAQSIYAAPGNDRAGSDNPRGKVNRIFSVLDTNASETITLDEWLVRVSDKAANQFARLDTTDDELISLEEFLAAGHGSDDSEIDRDLVRACVEESLGTSIPERADRSEQFAGLDSNEDGFIDFDEFLAAKTDNASARFDAIDSDTDGAVTKQELADAFSDQRERRTAKRACVEEQREMEVLLEG